MDPTVQLLRKKDLIFEQKRVNRDKTNSMPPIGTPSWCLSIEALKKFGRPTDNIPNYDPEGEYKDIEDIEDENSDYQNDESVAESSRKKKKKKQQKRRMKEKQKKKERKEKRTKTRK